MRPQLCPELSQVCSRLTSTSSFLLWPHGETVKNTGAGLRLTSVLTLALPLIGWII